MKDRFPTPVVDERDVYPTCFGAETWFAQKLTNEDPPRKIPRAPWAYPDHPDRYVGHNDPNVWTAFETARKWTSKLPGFGLANRVPDVEADEARPVFFDFDDVRDPETGESTLKRGSSFRRTTSPRGSRRVGQGSTHSRSSTSFLTAGKSRW